MNVIKKEIMPGISMKKSIDRIRMLKKLASIAPWGFLVLGSLLVACAKQTENDNVVNVYTHRHYEIDKQLFEKFTEETGIDVNVISASADQLIERLDIEGKNSPADLLITVDAGRLHRAKEKGLLQAIDAEKLKSNIPGQLRDPEGFWFGLTKRARIIVYSRERVNPEQLSTYEALADERWKGKILVRSSGNIYNQSLLASIIVANGKVASREWAKGLVANLARNPKGNDRDQVKAIAAGIGDAALVNSYYVGRMMNSGDAAEKTAAEKVGVFFPNQEGRGTHINVSGAGVTASAKHKENAIKLLEFLSSVEVQEQFASANYEYPVNPKAKNSALLDSWGAFKADNVNLTSLGVNNSDAVKIFDEVGWK